MVSIRPYGAVQRCVGACREIVVQITSLWSWQPLGDIVDYFGEKTGFYFSFLVLYTTFLTGKKHAQMTSVV